MFGDQNCYVAGTNMTEVAKELTELVKNKYKCIAKIDTVRKEEPKNELTHGDYKDKLILRTANTCEGTTRIRYVANYKHRGVWLWINKYLNKCEKYNKD